MRMEQENNSTLIGGYPRVLSDPRNAALFFTISIISMTLGNFLLHVLRKFVNENQNAVLTDRLESFLLLVQMVFNAYVFLLGLAIYLDLWQGHVFCAIFSITLRQMFMMMLIIGFQSIVVRLLFMTVWKNAGAIDDEIFMCFMKITTIFFAVLYGGNLAFYKMYLSFPNYIVCMAGKIPTQVETTTDLTRICVGITLLLGLIAVFVLCHHEGHQMAHFVRLKDLRGGGLSYSGWVLVLAIPFSLPF